MEWWKSIFGGLLAALAAYGVDPMYVTEWLDHIVAPLALVTVIVIVRALAAKNSPPQPTVVVVNGQVDDRKVDDMNNFAANKWNDVRLLLRQGRQHPEGGRHAQQEREERRRDPVLPEHSAQRSPQGQRRDPHRVREELRRGVRPVRRLRQPRR